MREVSWRRLPIELGGRDGRLVELVLDDAPVTQAQHAICHARDGGIVGDNDDGAAVGAVDVLHELQDFLGRLVVERARGLVAQQQARVFDERATDGTALLLAARNLTRKFVAVLVEAQRTQQVVDIERVLDRCAVTSMFSLMVRSGTRL